MTRTPKPYLNFHRDESLIDVGCYIGVYVELEFLYPDSVHQSVDFTLQGVCEEYRRTYFAFAEAGGAYLLYGDVDCRTHPLACYLHQSELAQWQDVVLCAVFLHVLHHAFV